MSDRIFDYRYSGGSLDIGDPTYVTRQADRDFFDGLMAGEFCYVLNSRQMGKSSLRVKTMARLQAEGVVCVFIDLTGIGKEGVTPEQWYADIVRSLVNSCRLQLNWRKWWREQRDLLSPPQRLKVFIEEILLVEIQQKIVIFIDEIDRVLSHDFSLDDFFGIIRACYNLRGNKPEYQRLTWSVLGVATPADLIDNPLATPFNIGKAIALKGFQITESSVLASGFQHLTDDPQKVIAAILSWTGGQPFLTQKLCWLIANADTFISPGKETEFVAKLVRQNLIANWEAQDEPPHLKTIYTRIINSPNSTKKLLKLYQKILNRGKISFRNSLEYKELQLSGLVVRQGKYLQAYNPIYKEIFGRKWVKNRLDSLEENSKISPQLVLVFSILLTFLVGGIRSLGLLQSWELTAYDLFVRHRPLETKNNQLLIVGITEKDLNTYGYPIPDSVLASLIQKLDQHKPSGIGLDIIRDLPVPKDDLTGHKALNFQFKNNTQLIPICTLDSDIKKAISPPSASPPIQLGFANLYDDLQYQKGKDIVRRYLLSRSSNNPDEICSTNYSFAWQLIYLYFENKGIGIDTVNGNWRFGSLVAKRLQKRSAGYQNLDFRGNQLLINYRHTDNPKQITEQISLSEFLNNTSKLNADLIKNKIVLIGVTAPSIQDWHDTPYGEMRGIQIHAHAIDQIISAVEDNRPLIRWLSVWQDLAFIGFWSFAGGLITWRFENVFFRNLGIAISSIILFLFCWLFFIQGLWLALIPAVIGLLATAIALIGYKRWRLFKIENQ